MFKLMWNTWVSSITDNYNMTTISIDVFVNPCSLWESPQDELDYLYTEDCACVHYPSVAEIQTAPVTNHKLDNIPF